MGTTLTLIYIGNNGVTAAYMGDSRIYHFRFDMEHTVLFISRDHSLAFDLYQTGEITYEEMAIFPQKNIVTRAMTPGIVNRMQPDIIHITDIKSGDWFYLCSDGMLEQMTDDELLTLLSSEATDEEKRRQLIEATLNNYDNHSAWLIHVESVVKEEGDDQLVNDEPTSRSNAINIIRQREKDAGEEDVVIVEKGKKAKSLIERMKCVVDIIMNKAD
jgi:protein phosphatase